jgi:hypothetical protein
MGFFKKVFTGVTKVFSKAAKAVKSAFKSFGRFMNKIGIVGQIAMMFILPAIGTALLGTTAAGAAAAAQAAVTAGTATAAQAAIVAGTAQAVGTGLLGGALGPLGVAAGKAAVWVGQKIAAVKSVFTNVTSGIFEVAGNFAKTATNKMASTLGFENVPFKDAAANFFGPGKGAGLEKLTTNSAGVADSAFSRSFGADSKFQNLTKGSDFFKGVKQDRLDQVKVDATADVSDNFQIELNQDTKFNTKNISMDVDPNTAEGNFGIDMDTVNPNFAEKLPELGTSSDLTVPEINLSNVKYEDTFDVSKLGLDPNSDLSKYTNLDVVDTSNTAFNIDPNALSSGKYTSLDSSSLTNDASNNFGIDLNSQSLTDASTPQTSLLGGSTSPEKGFFRKLGTDIVDRARDSKLGGLITNPVDTIFTGFGDKASGAIQNQLLVASGLRQNPVSNQYASQYVNRTPTFETASLGGDTYGSSPIMSANAFETNVTQSTSPYGFTAMSYGNYMNEFNQQFADQYSTTS